MIKWFWDKAQLRDFTPNQMDCDDVLMKLGLARLGLASSECVASTALYGRSSTSPSRPSGSGVAGPLASGTGVQGHRVSADDAAGGHLVAGTPKAGRGGSDVDSPDIVAFGGNNPGPLDVATTCNAKGGTGRLDLDSETFVVGPRPVTVTLGSDPISADDLAQPVTGRNGDPGCVAHAEPVAYDPNQVTSRTNRSDPQPGAPCHTLPGEATPPIVVFGSKGDGGDASDDLSPTVRASMHDRSHQNAGAPPAVACFDDPRRYTDPHAGGDHGDLHPTLEGGTLKQIVVGDEPVPVNEIGKRCGKVARTRDGTGVGKPGDPAFTVTADGRQGVAQTGYIVRRLMPVECFPPDTTVGDGACIGDVAIGDSVLVATGGIGRVQATFRRRFTGDMVRLTAQGIMPFSATPDHPVMVAAGRKTKGRHGGRVLLGEPEWLHASEVRVWKNGAGHFMVIPRLDGVHEDRSIDLRRYVINNHRNHVVSRKVRGLPDEFSLNENSAWLLGLYVAEGCAGVTKNHGGHAWVDITPGWSTELAHKAAAILTEMGFKNSTRSMKTSLNVHAASAPLARMLVDLCGDGAAAKRVPMVVLLHRDLSLLAAFVKGYCDGDGYKRVVGGGAGANTVSRSLALGLQLALARLGICAGVRHFWRDGGVIDGRAIKGGMLYAVTWRQSSSPRHARNKVFDRYIAVPVKSAELMPYDGDVCNFETTDNTYIVNGAVVHNCERLQGYPDGHTLVPYRRRPADRCADGPRLRAIGNGWSSNVFAWVGRRIQEHVDARAKP